MVASVSLDFRVTRFGYRKFDPQLITYYLPLFGFFKSKVCPQLKKVFYLGSKLVYFSWPYELFRLNLMLSETLGTN